MTLMELLVVFGLLSVITGVGVSMMRKQDKGVMLATTARQIRANLRVARTSARKSGAGSMVRIAAGTGRIEAFPVEVGGNWHFEDDTGARGTRVAGVPVVDGGWMGRCARLNGGALDLGSYPFFATKDGLRLSFWIKVDRAGGCELAGRDRVFHFGVRDDGAFTADVQVGEQGESVRLETRGGLLRAGEWTKVAMAYDRMELAIEVRGVVYARRSETRVLTNDAPGHLTVGGRGFVGLIDEVRYDVIQGMGSEELPKGIGIGEDRDIVVRFDDLGRLDVRFHQQPIRIPLRALADETRTDQVVVDTSGVVR
jgi:hypothetical protein